MKKELENIKKTADAHGTVSEEEALRKAENITEVAEETIEKEIEEELKKEIEETERVVLLEKKPEKKTFGREEVDLKESWEPITKLGREVKDNKIKDIDEILGNGKKILEPEIVDYLLKIDSDLISIGQSKGKFGGGKRRAWRQTQRKTKEGNVATFSTLAVVGDKNGHLGIGSGKAKETLPARDKAIRKAKLNIFSIKRGCSSFDCSCSEPHTVPFEVSGKSGSVRVTLIPAPQGTGLVVANELKKILILAGIKDVYSKSFGHKRTTFNFVKACIDALKKIKIEGEGKK
jgi:small subunit ribosomal protein S5